MKAKSIETKKMPNFRLIPQLIYKRLSCDKNIKVEIYAKLNFLKYTKKCTHALGM